jgi:hypothetical protein
LIKYGLIQQNVSGGPYSLTYKTPLCFIFGKRLEKVTTAYVGLLGERNERMESETRVAINLLRKEGIDCSLICVVTSRNAAKF